MNPNCDGGKCVSTTGTVRRLPISIEDNSAVILCYACYCHEIGWRMDRNQTLPKENRYPTPQWDSLDIYNG